MREIKFRFWLANNHEPRMHYFDLRDEELNFRTIIDRGSVLLQYTGLKDKNGVEIYEGDVVEIENQTWKTKYAIYWNETSAAFMLMYTDGDGGNSVDGVDAEYIYEVIGNIYENPELLKGATS